MGQWSGTRPSEKGNTHKFWLSLLRDVVGMQDVTTEVQFEVKTARGGWIDVLVPGSKVLIEQKSAGLLDKIGVRQGNEVTPFEQALGYANTMRNTHRPDTIIVCDFEEFRLHDLRDSDDPAQPWAAFTLEELPEQLHLLDFFIKPQQEKRLREEKITMDAGRLVGELYKGLSAAYPNAGSAASQHALNVLCVRLVFLLFAEDAGLLPKDFLADYLKDLPVRAVRTGLIDLFDVLDIEREQRDPSMDPMLLALPYVNGGLFRGAVEVPQFSDELVKLLIETSRSTDWSAISPTIFGGIFEGTLNPETRRENGMHYTSPKNIHRVIDPLFLDSLKSELEALLAPWDDRNARLRALSEYRTKLAGLHVFDPACGSGNFLTETYRELRRLEAAAFAPLLEAGAPALASSLKVSLKQFHGIEVNDFAKSVAETSLWIAQIQANSEMRKMGAGARDLPLVDSADIRLGNALELDWASVLDPSECAYLIGNPPFVGARMQTKEQKAEVMKVFGGAKNAGNVDYVAGWFMKAAQYMGEHPVRAAFVSTNSICQGEQVANIWSPLYDLGIAIDFAHDSFKWSTEATGGAAVFVSIVGFSKQGGEKRLWTYPRPDEDGIESRPTQLNAYLKDAPNVFVWSRSKPLNDVPVMGVGNQPIDGGHYLFTVDEKVEFLAKEPGATRFFRRWYGAQEFIKGIERWVLWLGEATPAELLALPECHERIELVRQERLSSSRASTLKLASTPTRFQVENMPSGESILVPSVSSERRRYVPMGYLDEESLASNLVLLVPDATRYHFGVLTSRLHNAWVRMVAGRLESRYRYSAGSVYNTFVWPETDAQQQDEIAALAQRVLDEREVHSHQGVTIAQMYDPSNEWMFAGLFSAHAELDAAIERAYGLQPGLEESELVAHLFALYEQATS